MVKQILSSYSSLQFIYKQCKLQKTHGNFSRINFEQKWNDFITILDDDRKRNIRLPRSFFVTGFLYCDFVLTNDKIGETDLLIKNQLRRVKNIKKFLTACTFKLPASFDSVLPPQRVDCLLKLFSKVTKHLINHAQGYHLLSQTLKSSASQKKSFSLLKQLCSVLNLLCTIWITHVSKIFTWWSLRRVMNCLNDDIYSLDVLYLLGLCQYVKQLDSRLIACDVKKSFSLLYSAILAMQLATLKILVHLPIYNQPLCRHDKSNATKTNFLFRESFQDFLKQLEKSTAFPFQTSVVLKKQAQRSRKFTLYDLVCTLDQRVRFTETNLLTYRNENKNVIFQQIGYLHCLPYFFSCLYFQSQELDCSYKKSPSDSVYAVLIFLVNLQYNFLKTVQGELFPLMESLVTINRLLQLLILYHLEAPSDTLQENFKAMLNALLHESFSILKNPQSPKCLRNEVWKCLQEIFSISIQSLDDHLLCCLQCSSDEEIVLKEISIETKRNETLAFIMKKLAKASDLGTFFETLEIFISQTTTSSSVEPFSIKSLLSTDITECIKILCDNATLTQLSSYWNQLLTLVNNIWIIKDENNFLSLPQTEAYFVCCIFLSNFLRHVIIPENFLVAIIPIVESVNSLLHKTKPLTTFNDFIKKDFQKTINSLTELSNQAYLSLLYAQLHLCTQLDNWMNPCDSQKVTNHSRTFLQPSETSDFYRETLIESAQKHMKIFTNCVKAASKTKNLPDFLLTTTMGDLLLRSCHLLLELCIAYPSRYYKDTKISTNVIKVLHTLFSFNSKIKNKSIQYQHFCCLLPLCCALIQQFQKNFGFVSLLDKLFKKITRKIFMYFLIEAADTFYNKLKHIPDFSQNFLSTFLQNIDSIIYNFITACPLIYQSIVLHRFKKIAEKKIIESICLLTNNFMKYSTFQIEQLLVLLKIFSCFFSRYPHIFLIKSKHSAAIIKFLKKLCHATPSFYVVCSEKDYHQLNDEMKNKIYMIHLVDSFINSVLCQTDSLLSFKASFLKLALILSSLLQSCITEMAGQITDHNQMPSLTYLLHLNTKLFNLFKHHLLNCDMRKHKKRMAHCIEGINILCSPIAKLQLSDSFTLSSNPILDGHLHLCITLPCNSFLSCSNFLQTLPAFYSVREALSAFPDLQIQANDFNDSFIERVYSFLPPFTDSECISFLEQSTYLTSNSFLSILITLCQRKENLTDASLVKHTRQVLSLLAQHSTLFPQDLLLLKFKNILNHNGTELTFVSDIIRFSFFIFSHINDPVSLDVLPLFSTVIEILYNKTFYYLQDQCHSLKKNIAETSNVLQLFSDIFNPTQAEFEIQKVHVNHYWQFLMKQITKHHQMISLIKILFEKSSFDSNENHKTFFQFHSYMNLTTLLTCLVFISQQRVVLFNFLGIRKQTKKNTDSVLINKIQDSKLIQLLRHFVFCIIFMLRSQIQFFPFPNLLHSMSKQSQDCLSMESFIKKCRMWVVQFKLLAQITINIHEACKLGILQQKNNDYWKMSFFYELLNLTVVGLYQHSEISRCLNCLCNQNCAKFTDSNHVWVLNKKKKSAMIAQIFFLHDILATTISSCCYATVSLRKDICSRNSLPYEFFYRHLLKRTHQLKYIVQEMCRILDSTPSPETTLSIVRQLIRIWNCVYLTPCSLSKILKREIVHVLQSVLSLNILTSTSLSTTRSFNFKSNLFNLFVSVPTSHLQQPPPCLFLDYSDEETKWQNVKSILLYDGLYPLLESMDDTTKQHFFAEAPTNVRDTFTKIHKDFMNYRSTHAFRKD